MDIGDSFQRTTDGIFSFLPNLLGFLLLLLIGFVVAKLVEKVVRTILQKVGLDRRLADSDASRYIDAVLPGAKPSNGIAKVVFWLIFLIFLVTALGVLEIPVLTSFVDKLLAYLPNIVAAILIFVVAALISGAVAGAVTRFMGDTSTGKIVATVVPALVMVIALFMILEQLQIAPEIVRIAFACVMGALALGLALAFGLGGRDVAARMLEDAHRSARDAKEQAKRDLEQGKQRAQEEWEQSDLSGGSSDDDARVGSQIGGGPHVGAGGGGWSDVSTDTRGGFGETGGFRTGEEEGIGVSSDDRTRRFDVP